MSTATISIKLSKSEKERLDRLALRYGLSLPDFSRRILTQLSSEKPSDSFRNYEQPEALRASFKRALRDWKSGRIRTKV